MSTKKRNFIIKQNTVAGSSNLVMSSTLPMAFHIFLITLLTCPLITFGEGNSGNSANSGNSGNSDQTPFCDNADVPFQNDVAAFEYIKYYERECKYNYWKLGSDYHGMNGYKQMYGGTGHMFNESTVLEYDGLPVRGYYHTRAKAVVGQNLIAMTAKPSDIELLVWSEYEVFYKLKAHIAMKVGPLRNLNQTIESFVKRTAFEDDSGIVKHIWQNSTSSIFGAWTFTCNP
eukprot:370287_1